MAATKLIAMHQNKGRSVMQCLKDRTDYAMNGEKTEEGKYISLHLFLHRWRLMTDCIHKNQSQTDISNKNQHDQRQQYKTNDA